MIGDIRPVEATDYNTVRASFIRFLTLGGDDRNPTHERGLRLVGAWVEAKLDLVGCEIQQLLQLSSCSFGGPITATNLRLHGLLDLSGSSIIKLNLEGAEVFGDVFLRNSFQSNGEVRLIGVHIDGDLDCSGALLKGNGGPALIIDRAKIGGAVFLRAPFHAVGEVRLWGAKLYSELDCSGAILNGVTGDALTLDGAEIGKDVIFNENFHSLGMVRLVNAKIAGNLVCKNARFDSQNSFSLCCESMRVTGRFYLHDLLLPIRISLDHAQVGVLIDDEDAWWYGSHLNGFIYGSFGFSCYTDSARRVAWLNKQTSKHNVSDADARFFLPQPWQQLKKVLREMGHSNDAAEVGIAYEKHQRLAGRKGGWYSPQRWMHWLYGVLIGYGYRPMKLVRWMIAVWLFCSVIFWCAAVNGLMSPSNPLVFQNPAYAACRSNWYFCETLPEEYTGFSPLAYSLDVILPVIDLQQENDWAPLIPTPISPWYKEWITFSAKHGVRIVLWIEIFFGWIGTVLLVAVVTGLAKSTSES